MNFCWKITTGISWCVTSGKTSCSFSHSLVHNKCLHFLHHTFIFGEMLLTRRSYFNFCLNDSAELLCFRKLT